jgi:predicted dehydrogenase
MTRTSPDDQPRSRAAIIGTGRIASLLERDPLRTRPHTHAAWYASHPRTTLVAGCDIDPERLAAFGEDWRIAPGHLYGEYASMLRDERPDLVSICAYATDRVAMCRAALAAGARGLWIEKAVACSVEEARALASEIDAAGVAAIVDHPRRTEPRYRAVARWLREETFGRLETVHVVFSGHVIHTGTHAWDLLLDWCGPWARVDASLDAPDGIDPATGDAREALDVATAPRVTVPLAPHEAGTPDRGGRARIVFANGIEAYVTGGAKRYFVFQCDLVCTEGRVRIGNDLWEVLRPADSPRYTGYRELATVCPDEWLRAEDADTSSLLDALVRSIESGTPPAQSVAAAADALALGIAMMQAGLTGRTVTPASLDPTLRIEST